jgi:uncharacterized protein YndB with AHSA1/START domain
MIEQAEGVAVRQSVLVQAPPERAFEVFTAGMSTWWPLDSHYIGKQPATAVVIEPRAGGRWFERADDGSECDWGEVLAWEPPHRLRYLWHLRFDRADATEVEIVFAPAGEGTDVTITHRGWERLGAKGPERRERNRRGWDGLIPHYRQACAPAG